MKSKAWVVAVVVVSAALLAGCQTRKAGSRAAGAEGGAVAQQGAAGAQAGQDAPATATGIGSAGSVGGEAGISGLVPAELDGRRVVYFAFDSEEIRAEDRALLAAHARVLAANPSLRARLEGHTDERGTREYNIGLAERRAQAVRRALVLQGAAEGQLTPVSFGEEKPAAAGDDEAAYAQNRRVELVYGN